MKARCALEGYSVAEAVNHEAPSASLVIGPPGERRDLGGAGSLGLR